MKRVLAAAAVLLSIVPSSEVLAQNCAAPPPGLVSWWSADGHVDDIASVNDGETAPSYADGVWPGQFERSFLFDGTGSARITIPGDAGVSPTSAVTVAAWMRPAAVPGIYMTAYDRLGGGQGFGLSVRNNGHAWFTVNGGSGQVEGTTNLVDGQWHHVTATYSQSAGQIQVFVDGAFEAASSFGAAIDYNSSTRHGIGSSRNSIGNTFLFRGELDDLMVFNRALTASEVALLGTTRSCSSIAARQCAGVLNSTGVAAKLSAIGSPVAATNTLGLVGTSFPQNTTVFFLVSRQAGFTMNPGGSAGNLCLGGAIGRYVGPGQVMNSGAAGSVALGLELTAIPQPSGSVAAVAGDTLFFQAWHRDLVLGSATSNFSQAVGVSLR